MVGRPSSSPGCLILSPPLYRSPPPPYCAASNPEYSEDSGGEGGEKREKRASLPFGLDPNPYLPHGLLERVPFTSKETLTRHYVIWKGNIR